MAKKEEQALEQKKTESLFTKEQILASERYANRRDILDAILAEGQRYSVKQVDDEMHKFMGGKVK